MASQPAETQVHPDVEPLRRRALESIQLAIELFNRPHECARPETVLILLHHSFEMLLKSLIVGRTGTAIDEKRGYSYMFDTCLCMAEEQLDLITNDHRKFLSILDANRDSATHYYQFVPEPILYVLAQASVSLFNELIRKSTGRGLLAFLPNRVLPISATPPQQLARVVDEEFERLREILQRPDLPKQHAIAMLRPLMAFKIGGEERHRRMTSEELEVAIENLSAAENWRIVFPEIAKIQLMSEGDGIPVGFKVVKEAPEAMPVRVLKPGDPEPAGGCIIQKEINLFDKFNMGLNQLATHLELSPTRTLAMVREFAIQDDPEAYRELHVGRSPYKRYSKRALDILRVNLDSAEAVWHKRRSERSRKKGK